jgi:capsular polysaccharide biosynthesis protein
MTEGGLSMELMLLWRMLLRRWWIILLPVAVAAVIVVPGLLDDQPAAGGFSTQFSYTAAQVLEAIPNRDGDFQDVWLASELTVNAFTDWVRSDTFRDEIVAVTAADGLEIDPTVIGIAADNDRSTGQIFLSGPDAGQLELIAAAAIEVLQTRSAQVFPQLGDQPAQVTLLDRPQIAPAPPPLPNRFAPFIRLGLALAAGLGLALLVEYLDPTLRRREDVTALGVPVIGAIPRR